MNNEIKEILDKLKDNDWYEELDLTGTKWIELTWKETHLLLDYITNLQEENERLKNYMNNMGEYKFLEKNRNEKEHYKKSFEYASKEMFNYKSRNEKAIEYIKSYKNDYAPYELNDYNIRELLNILQGSDKDE